MEFLDTQILSYKFKNNVDLFDGEINGRYISSIVALEFLGIMIKNENRAKIYPVKLRGIHEIISFRLLHNQRKSEFGKHETDMLTIDFNGEFQSIVIYSNEAISQLINEDKMDVLLLFARSALNKDEYKKFRERARFLFDNNITVVPISKNNVLKMQHIYEAIKHEYNVKANYRNSFMDLLILSTALEKNGTLITNDNELKKVIAMCYSDIVVSSNSKNGLISFRNKQEVYIEKQKNDNKGYVNCSWQYILRKQSR